MVVLFIYVKRAEFTRDSDAYVATLFPPVRFCCGVQPQDYIVQRGVIYCTTGGHKHQRCHLLIYRCVTLGQGCFGRLSGAGVSVGGHGVHMLATTNNIPSASCTTMLNVGMIFGCWKLHRGVNSVLVTAYRK